MRTKIIILGFAAMVCLGVSLLYKTSPPAPPVPKSALPGLSAESFRATPPSLAATAPIAETSPESPTNVQLPKRARKTSSGQSSDLREKIQAIIESADATDADLIFPMLAEWVRVDPAAAGRFAKYLPAGRWRETIVRRVAQDWAGQDAADAEKWASRLPDPSERESTVSAVCLQVAQTDARSAVEIAGRHGLGAAPGAVMENLVQQWANQDISSASAWIKEFPAGEQRDAMWGRLAYVQSGSQPAAAADLVVDQIPAGPIQNEAAISVLHQWAMRDMASATAWVGRFPPGDLRDRAEQELNGLAAMR